MFTDKDVGTCDYWALGDDDVCPKQARPWLCRITWQQGRRRPSLHCRKTRLDCCCYMYHRHTLTLIHLATTCISLPSTSTLLPPLPEPINTYVVKPSARDPLSSSSTSILYPRLPGHCFPTRQTTPTRQHPPHLTNNNNSNHSHPHTAHHRPMLLARQRAPLLTVPTDCAKPHSGVLPQET